MSFYSARERKKCEARKRLLGEDSNFDVAVLTVPEKNIRDLDNYTKILFGLSEILDIPDYKTDLTNLNTADPFLKYQIFSNDISIYGDERKYNLFKLRSIKEHLDMDDLRSLEHHMILKRQKLLSEKIYA